VASPRTVGGSPASRPLRHRSRGQFRLRLLCRQAALGVLEEARPTPPLSTADLQELYRAPLHSESLFGGQLASTHQALVDWMQVRPVLIAPPGSPSWIALAPSRSLPPFGVPLAWDRLGSVP
jgi:hypothetical protein